MCVVTVPAKARTKFAAEPDNAPLVTARVIAPGVAPLMAASSATFGASVISTVPVCVVTVPSKALTKLAAEPEKFAAIVKAFNVIAPVVAALIVTNSASVAASSLLRVIAYALPVPVNVARSVASSVMVAVITPDEAASIIFAFATLSASVTAIVPVCVVTVPSTESKTNQTEPQNYQQ